MGDHCTNCRYKVSETLGEDACPFNALYWDFLERHRARFEANPRMKMMYRNVDRMKPDQLDEIRKRAKEIRARVGQL
jgi:deoxyribodipyrimidine photolyase-related protein